MDKNSKRIIASKKIVFAVPGSKVYISSFYKNRPKSFLNISLTGNRCSLMCTHCRGKLLESMASADGVDLYKIIENESANGLEGVLISGGFNDMGVLEMEGRYKQIKAVKDHFPDLKVLIHAGFVSRQMAHSLAKTGCDGVLLNVTGSSDAIENVYNLKGFKPQHYFNSLINLKESGLKTAPHIVVGLGNTHNNHDMEALKNILEIGADWLVLVSVVNLFYTAGRAHKNYLADASSNKSTGSKRYFKNKQDIDLRKANELKRNEDNAARILALAEYAKKAFPDLKISLGCAKPGGKTGHMLEACLIKTGIDSIAFPSEKTIIYAKENNIDFEFIESCCALL